MKKSKLSLGLISCLLSVGALAGCDTIKSSSDGVLLKYKIDGVWQEPITADSILGEYYNDSTKYQAIFDTIYSVIARNYFAKDRETVTYGGVEKILGADQMKQIRIDAQAKVDDDKDTAQTNADTNNTKYKKEFEAILESKGVENETELKNKYIEELQKETFENNFYTYKIEDIKNGATDVVLDGKQFWNGYINDESPYHVSHIMVKLSDSSDTNYYNGTISEENAKRLYNVINELSSGAKTFSKIAKTYNEDPGSKEKEGDLGIMDYDTSFINEFKLGIYAYEMFYKGRDVSKSNIKVSADIETNFLDQVKDAFGYTTDQLPTVDFSVFEELQKYAEDDLDENDEEVIENSTLVYPRNILYNKYLNIHSIFFIKNGTADNGNFKVIPGLSTDAILCADGNPEKPIIAVRGSSGGEQEIHLMVINRSPFVAVDANGVKLNDYYTTYYPAQDLYYPTVNGKKLDTYVNFLSNEVSDTKSRAEEFVSKIKSYNSDKLSKYIFLKYKEVEKITFAEENKALEEALMKWIKTSVEKKDEESQETYTKTWNEYIDKLVRQNSERNKLVPEACKLVYKYGNDNRTTEELVNEEFTTDAEKDAFYGELADAAVAAGLTTEAEKLDYIKGTVVKNYFKVKEGLCNDGKEYK